MSVIKFGAWQDLSGNEVANSSEPIGDVGLVFIKSQNIDSGASSVTVTDAFSATFENYKIIYWVTSSVNVAMQVTIDGVTSPTGYNSKAHYSAVYAAAGWTSVLGALDAWTVGWTNASESASATIEIYRPYANATVRFASQFSSYVAGVAFGETVATSGTQSTDILLKPATGTFSGGQIRVYGYRN